ncbi:MAG: hypothetical protein Q7Q73_06740 [Verrucomicrobiota bacterium JB024]|nr:hypothetical protein [Verrucomicrobiota bacterium JB024]
MSLIPHPCTQPSPHRPARYGALMAAALFACLSPQPAVATMPNTVLQVTATTSATPPFVTLAWPLPASYSTSSPQIWRMRKGETYWGTAITLPGGTHSWADTGAQPGIAYEYSVHHGSASGAIVAGYNLPLVEQRGKVLLYVDETQAAALAPELEQLQLDLVADGWTVYRHDGPRGGLPRLLHQSQQLCRSPR